MEYDGGDNIGYFCGETWWGRGTRQPDGWHKAVCWKCFIFWSGSMVMWLYLNYKCMHVRYHIYLINFIELYIVITYKQ